MYSWDPSCLHLLLCLPIAPLTLWSTFSNTFSPDVWLWNLNLQRIQIETFGGPGAMSFLRLRAPSFQRGMVLPSHCPPDGFTHHLGWWDMKSWPVHVGLDYGPFHRWLPRNGASVESRMWFCCSVAKSCLTLCDPMDCSTPGFPVLHYSRSLLKLMSIESMMPSKWGVAVLYKDTLHF